MAVASLLFMLAVGSDAKAQSAAVKDPQKVVTATEPDPKWRKHVGLAYNQYREPSVGVRFDGPELVGGVQWFGEPNWVLSSELMLGLQHYSSPSSGTRSGIPNADWRAEGLYALEQWAPMWRGVQSGLNVQLIYTDFSGKTSLGQLGYVRESRRLWWPVRWTQPLSSLGLEQTGLLEIEVAMLLYGEQISKLSAIGGAWRDAPNRQSKGMYLQIKRVGTGQGRQLEPYVRLTHMGTSDTVSAGTGYTATEPRNLRMQLGLNWTW